MNKPITFRTVISMMLIFLFNIPLHAQELSALEGRILDENGEVMQGVLVEVFSGGIKRGTTKTDLDGTYRIKPLLNGSYDIVARYPAYEEARITDIPVSCSTPATVDINFTPKVFKDVTLCGKVRTQTLSEPAKSIAITGTLKNGYNEPAHGVYVEYYRKDTLRGMVKSSEKGCYRIDGLVPGKYTVVTYFNGAKRMMQVVNIDTIEYVDEKIVDFYANRKIFNNHGELVDNIPPSLAVNKADMLKPDQPGEALPR